MLSRHHTISDNLKGIRAQQKDFDKLYFAAMVSTLTVIQLSVHTIQLFNILFSDKNRVECVLITAYAYKCTNR